MQLRSQCIVKGTVDLIREDHLQNWYCYTQNKLIKGGAQMPRQQFFSTLKYGALTQMDIQNPMSTILYFKAYQTVLFLDNLLVQKAEALRLDELGYPQVELVCSSQLQGIWIYNQANAELLKLNKFGNCMVKTGNLAQYHRHYFEPLVMSEYNSFLYVLFKNLGIWVFDQFGALKQQISFPNVDYITIGAQDIISTTDTYQFRYVFTTAVLDSVSLPQKAQHLYIGPQHIFNIFKDSVCTYKR